MRKLRAALILLAFAIFTIPLMPVQLVLRLVNSRWARSFPHWYHRQLCRLLGVTIHQSGELARDRPVLLIAANGGWTELSLPKLLPGQEAGDRTRVAVSASRIHLIYDGTESGKQKLFHISCEGNLPK